MRTTLLSTLIMGTATSAAMAQSTAFTYQGRLTSAGQPAAGLHDFRFRLFDAATGGAQVGTVQCTDNVPVANGLFTTSIDFGQQFGTPSARFLEVEVRANTGLDCSSAASFVVLLPRHVISAAPLASHARAAFALTAADGSPANAVFVDNAGNVGIGTNTPGKRVSIDGDMEVGVGTSDYHHLRIGGGNSDGFLYGSFPHFGDGIHMGYNYFANASGANQIIHPDGGTSRVSMHYGAVALATAPAFGGEPLNRLLVGATGNVGIGTESPLAKLDVRGDIRLGASGQFRATGGEESLRIVRGIVAANGAILAGSGFSVSHGSIANYVITFTTPFQGPPSVTATPHRPSNDSYAASVMTDGITGAAFTLVVTREQMINYGPVPGSTTPSIWEDETFSFIAVGPR